MARSSTNTLDYIRKLYAPQDALLEEINAKLKEIDMEIQVGPEEGKLLALLVNLHQARRIIEVGTLGGYSTLWMARALPDDGHIHTLERDAGHAAIARGFFARSDVADRITLHEGDATKTLASLKGPFDMIFIDADKISYPKYLDWADVNIRKGGLIVADNTFLFGTILQDSPPDNVAKSTWENMRRFNERLADPKKYYSVMIPTQEGLSLAIKLNQ